MKKINQAVIRIPSTLDDFFLYWCKFLRPLHNLTDREMEIAAEILKERHYISKSIEDPDLIDSVLLSADKKKLIRERVGISIQHFNCVIKRLKDVKILQEGNKINKRFIPKITDNEENFSLTLFFEFKPCQ